MASPVTTGDVALTAQPATEETFAPYGRLLMPGDRTYVGKRGRMLLAIDEKRAGPRRVTDLYRYPEAKRVLLPLGAVGMWFVALQPGEQPAGEACAFLLPPGCGVLVNEGVWHAGPMPLVDTSMCEMLETAGAADRFDRRSLRELIDVAAVRVQLPDDPAQSAPAFVLAASGSVRVDPALEGRIRLACVALSALRLEDSRDELDAEIAKTVEGLRAMWGHTANLSEIPGVQAGREVFRQAGIDQARFPPPSEALLADVLAGRRVGSTHALDGALKLCALRMRIPLTAFDAGVVAGPIAVRAGAPDEAYPAEDGRRIAVEGLPVLSDAAGLIGGPLGAAQRSGAHPGTREAVVAVFCPRSADARTVEAWLDGLVRTVTAHCGGRETHRLVLG